MLDDDAPDPLAVGDMPVVGGPVALSPAWGPGEIVLLGVDLPDDVSDFPD